MNVNITLTEKEFEQFKAYQKLERKSGRGLDYIVTVDVRHEREALGYIHERDLRVLIIELRDYIESFGGWIHRSIKAGLHSKINILEDYVAGEDIIVPYKEEEKMHTKI